MYTIESFKDGIRKLCSWRFSDIEQAKLVAFEHAIDNQCGTAVSSEGTILWEYRYQNGWATEYDRRAPIIPAMPK